MTEEKNTTPQHNEKPQPAPEQAAYTDKKESNPLAQLGVFAVVVAALIVFAIFHPRAALSVLLVAVGFGGVVMVHELGHFLVAKLGGIKVEAFSIGFPPVLLGIRKLKKGFRVRFLPRLGQPQQLEEGDSETEYQIGLVPLGGYVKMLGQSDSGAAERTDDPRSFQNRPTWIRIAVVAAGVTFNAIAAIVLFMALFSRGIDLIPAVIGDVMPNSPAYEAGLRPGDEVVEVNGERFVDYEALMLAPVLSGKGRPITLVVRREGGREDKIRVVAEKPALSSGDMAGMRTIGISPAHTLTISPKIAQKPKEVKLLYELTGLRPGDEIKAVNNIPVKTPWEFKERISKTLAPTATLTVSRSWPPGSPRTLETISFPVRIGPVVPNFREEFDLAHIFGLRPCLKVAAVSEPAEVMGLFRRLFEGVKSLFGADAQNPEQPTNDKLQAGDMLIRVAGIAYPNYRQLRETTTAHKGKDMAITVLRADDTGRLGQVDLTVRPFEIPRSDRVAIGFIPELAMVQPIVAQVVEEEIPGIGLPQLPPGATIVAVDGQPVKTFYEVANLLEAKRGQRIPIDYIDSDGRAGGTGMIVPQHGGVHVAAQLETGLAALPFEDYRIPFKADNVFQAAGMGVKKVHQFIVRTLMTLYRLIKQEVPTSSLMGPVGIISVSYTIADTSLIHYLYFLGLLSSILAVMNLLPLPVLDGGVILMLVIEKIIGRPINEKVQAAVTYAGLALILALMLLVTYNDILRILFG